MPFPHPRPFSDSLLWPHHHDPKWPSSGPDPDPQAFGLEGVCILTSTSQDVSRATAGGHLSEAGRLEGGRQSPASWSRSFFQVNGAWGRNRGESELREAGSGKTLNGDWEAQPRRIPRAPNGESLLLGGDHNKRQTVLKGVG